MIKVSSGSVIGKYHVGIGKNNQDAYFAKVYGDRFVGVVCDGCGSGECSEVGSNIGGNLLVRAIEDSFLISPTLPSIDLSKFDEIKRLLTVQLSDLAYKIDRSIINSIRDYLLFTIVGAFCDGENVCIFSIGDGFYALNGEVKEIGPYEDNMPPYIAYNAIPDFVNKNISQEYLNFKVHEMLPFSEFNTLMIGTDGVGDLIESSNKNIPGKNEAVGNIDQFWNNESFFNNDSMLGRKLSMINREFSRVKDGWLQHEKGHLKDDTTIIVFKKFDERLE